MALCFFYVRLVRERDFFSFWYVVVTFVVFFIFFGVLAFPNRILASLFVLPLSHLSFFRWNRKRSTEFLICSMSACIGSLLWF